MRRGKSEKKKKLNKTCPQSLQPSYYLVFSDKQTKRKQEQERERERDHFLHSLFFLALLSLFLLLLLLPSSDLTFSSCSSYLTKLVNRIPPCLGDDPKFSCLDETDTNSTSIQRHHFRLNFSSSFPSLLCRLCCPQPPCAPLNMQHIFDKTKSRHVSNQGRRAKLTSTISQLPSLYQHRLC